MVQPSDFAIRLGQRLRAARVNAGVTQEEAAGFIGLSRPSIANVEAGRQPALAEDLPRYALLYGIDPCWLLLGETAAHKVHGLSG